MKKLKMIALILLSTLGSVSAVAQGAVAKKPPSPRNTTTAAPAAKKESAPASQPATGAALPTAAEVGAYIKRSFGYDPAVTWQVAAVRESEVPGVVEIVVSMNRGEGYHLYYSPSAQVAFVGQVLPFGPNPYAPARLKLHGAFGPSRGAADAPIEIVEFSDLQCPHCKAAQPIVEKLQADFPQVRFTFQQYPLPASIHPWATKAAQYADCAGQLHKDNFWKYVDSIFENQGGIALATADDRLKELAVAAGYDALEISRCAASPETDARVQKSLALGESLNVNQTPTVFINGRAVLGIASIPYESLKNLVQFEIDHAGR